MFSFQSESSPHIVNRTCDATYCIMRHRWVRVKSEEFVFKLLISSIFIVTSLVGCASEVLRSPSQLIEGELTQDQRVITFTDNVSIKLSSGYSRVLKKSTKWKFVGTIKEGNVFKPVDTIFTIEGAHIREAYLVIFNNRLMGFYLPGENSFSSLAASILLPINMGE